MNSLIHLTVLFYLASLLSITLAFQRISPSSILRTSRRNMSVGGTPSSFYDIVEKDSQGNDVSFEKYRGKVVYGVNVASRCGYTASGYALLSKISQLKDRGVEVAIFPCNQFGGQEPGSDSQIESFCVTKGVQGATVYTKADVNGPNTRPTYKYLKEKGVFGDISWNFAGKFVVDKEGNGKNIRCHDDFHISFLIALFSLVLPVKSERTLEADILALAAK